MKVFIDTNILVYAMDDDQPAQQKRSRELLASFSAANSESPQGVLSTQVLQETFVAATRKLGVDPLKAKDVLEALTVLEIVTITPDMVFDAIDGSSRHQLSFWDALIVTAATRAGCHVIWTEDLNASQRMGNVRSENPFV